MAYSNKYYRPSSFGGFTFFPPVIKYLLIANGAVFLLQSFFGYFYFTMDSGERIFVSRLITEYLALMPLGDGFYPWQLLTFQFLHGSFSHILFNMLYLWMFGMEIENTVGSRKFLIFYLVSGVGAGLAQLLLTPLFGGGAAPTVGASGGVYGVLIAFALMFPDRPIYLYFFVPIKAKYLIGFMILIELFSVGDMSFVAHLAHLGGAITALVFVLVDHDFGITGKFKRKFQSNNFDDFTSGYTQYHPDKKEGNVIDVDFRELKTDSNSKVNQDEVDRILDKITKLGYQSLTAEEKKTLYDASKEY